MYQVQQRNSEKQKLKKIFPYFITFVECGFVYHIIKFSYVSMGFSTYEVLSDFNKRTLKGLIPSKS